MHSNFQDILHYLKQLFTAFGMITDRLETDISKRQASSAINTSN